MAKGRAAQRKQELSKLAEKLKTDPKLANNEGMLQKLREFARDKDTSVEAMALLASLPGPSAPDLLYALWVGTAKRTSITQIAEELVLTKEVRAKASPALGVSLDLRRAKTCEEFLAILPRATENGDRRSLGLLYRLSARRGCGPHKMDDCYPCLRDLDGKRALGDAIKDARGRPAPKL